MMADMQCPYCDADQKVCHDDGAGYDEGETHQHTCSECEKTFVFNTSISYRYSPGRADCLNDGYHEWVPTKTWPKEFTRMRCKACDEAREMTSAERVTHGIPDRIPNKPLRSTPVPT